MQKTEEIAGQFLELLQNFVRLQPKFIIPEHIVSFKQKVEALRSSGLNHPQDRIFLPRIFIILAKRETPPTMGELSTELDIPLSSTTRIVDWLVSADFVERCPDAHDRRVVRVCMTDTAREFIRTGGEFVKQRIAQLLSNFTLEEQTQLLQRMNKLLVSLQAKN